MNVLVVVVLYLFALPWSVWCLAAILGLRDQRSLRQPLTRLVALTCIALLVALWLGAGVLFVFVASFVTVVALHALGHARLRRRQATDSNGQRDTDNPVRKTAPGETGAAGSSMRTL